MSIEATKRGAEESEFLLESGSVLLTDGSTSVVRTRVGDVRATRAESCLVEPAARDLVLVAHSDGEAYVLAVLKRDQPGAMRVAVLAGKSTTVTTPKLEVQAAKGRARIDDFGFVGKVATVGVTMLKTVAESAERTAGRLVERLGRSYRFIEETENVRARDIDMRTEANLQLRGEHTVVMARKIVKVDGTQIHMG